VESFRAASHDEAASGRPSAESPELAGWTGQVEPERASARISTPKALGKRLRASRVAQLGALGSAAFALLFGVVHSRATPESATEKPVASGAQPTVKARDHAPDLGRASGALAAPPEAAPESNALVAQRGPAPKARPASKPAPRPLATKPRTGEDTRENERLNVTPTLIPSLEHFAH
jgi:hypothetical protein